MLRVYGTPTRAAGEMARNLYLNQGQLRGQQLGLLGATREQEWRKRQVIYDALRRMAQIRLSRKNATPGGGQLFDQAFGSAAGQSLGQGAGQLATTATGGALGELGVPGFSMPNPDFWSPSGGGGISTGAGGTSTGGGGGFTGGASGLTNVATAFG